MEIDDFGTNDSGPSNLDSAANYDYTAIALKALAEIDAGEEKQLEAGVQAGQAISFAKKHLPHGEFTFWCKTTLKRSPSYCSLQRRLFDAREDIPKALSWANEVAHKWAGCRSPVLVLKLIRECKRAADENSATPPKTRLRELTAATTPLGPVTDWRLLP
jgi:hypothetical protein